MSDRRPAKRVLVVGPMVSFKPSRGVFLTSQSGLMFYAFGFRLTNGFIRNGHFVLAENDRDSRKQMLSIKPAGAWLANNRLLHIARELQPDLLCLRHCDLIASATIDRIREMVPHCRIAVVYYDDLLYPPSAARFRRFLKNADFGFATTGGPTLSKFSDLCPVAFIPNPVDLAIDNLTAFSTPNPSFDVFGAFGVTGVTERWAMIDELRARKKDLRFALYGRGKARRILGDAYYKVIGQSKIGLNLNRYEADLYASDRMAQYLGNGLLLATSRRSGYAAYFSDEEMLFFDDIEELAEKIEWAIADDRRWREMAERARTKACHIMNGERVADFIMRMTLGVGAPDGWAFSKEIYLSHHGG